MPDQVVVDLYTATAVRGGKILRPLRMIIPVMMTLCLGSSVFGNEPEEVRTSFFNQKWLDAVVSIEAEVIEGNKRIVKPIGTGFIVGTERKHVLLVTAKHVMSEAGKTIPGLRYRLNETSGGTTLVKDEEVEALGAGPWYISPAYDVACRFLAWNDSSKFNTISSELFLSQKDVKVGARLVVLGFPLGLRSVTYASPIARQGMVARSDSEGIIADSFVFPGNSGGPVLYVPLIKFGKAFGSTLLNQERVIGLVSNYISYPEVAISNQTRRPRVVFEENSGLANIVPTDAILELIRREDVQERDQTLPIRQDTQ